MTVFKEAFFLAAAVAFLFSSISSTSASELQVFELELNETAASLADRLASSRAVHERLGTGASIRGFVATIAGQDTGRIVVIVEFPDVATRRAAEALIAGDAENAALMEARQAAGNTLVGNTRWTEILPSAD